MQSGLTDSHEILRTGLDPKIQSNPALTDLEPPQYRLSPVYYFLSGPVGEAPYPSEKTIG